MTDDGARTPGLAAADGRIVPVVLCGGAGTRLWPMSRPACPKPFLALTGEPTLYQQTLLRVADPLVYAPPVVVTGVEQHRLAAEQAEAAGVALGAVLLEPVPRGTAAAIAAGAAFVASQGGDRLLHVLPSDHEIAVDDAYRDALRDAVRAAECEAGLVAFGIVASQPETGFGYIRAGASIGEGVWRIDRFAEKPDRATAAAMIAAGGHYWNAGMFLFSCRTFLAECRALAPAVAQAAEGAVAKAVQDPEGVRLDASYAAVPDISVDHAIFEKTRHGCVVPAAIRWRDVGNWNAVWQAGEKDAAGNVVRGAATVRNVSGSLVISNGARVVLSELDDVAVIVTGDAILVTRLSKAQDAGALAAALLQASETHPDEDAPARHAGDAEGGAGGR